MCNFSTHSIRVLIPGQVPLHGVKCRNIKFSPGGLGVDRMSLEEGRRLRAGAEVVEYDDFGGLGLISIVDLRFHRRPQTCFWPARNLRHIENLPQERPWIDRTMVLSAHPQSGDSPQYPS